MSQNVLSYSLFTDFDIQLFNVGKHTQLYNKMGSHIATLDGVEGVCFAVYAPAALKVEVIGDFNSWQGHKHTLNVRWDSSGIWEGFIPNIGKLELYKYRIYSDHDGQVRDKTDPYARLYEMPPKTASIVWEDDFSWKDQDWLSKRKAHNSLTSPISVYEIHLGSWKKNEQESRSLHYKELAKDLVDYISKMGYTHVEFMPVMEHPYYPSWGYLCTGFFAPSSRYGNPDEFKYLIDALHQANIGIFLDWVPAHFPSDDYALAEFDGSKLFEHPDIQKGYHPDWNSLIFNYERPQIRSFLLSSAHFWFDQFHADGLRVDAVASMIYLDYSREEDQWTPNINGGNEYLAVVNFLKELNRSIYLDYPDIQMIAEESTAFPGVTKPVHLGGLGFGLKWMMGWMNDTLDYFQKDPIYRKYHHEDIKRSLTYALSENYMLPLSHDEVVHGKQSLVYKMPGNEWQQFANLRLLLTAMFTHPGQKMLFMGADIGQTSEWNVNESIPWHLLEFDPHNGIQKMVADLNHLYRKENSLYQYNYESKGFEWINCDDNENSILSFIRKSDDQELIVVLNFSLEVKENFRVGLPQSGTYNEIFNSDDKDYWGSGIENRDIESENLACQDREHSALLTLAPLAGMIFKLNKTIPK